MWSWSRFCCHWCAGLSLPRAKIRIPEFRAYAPQLGKWGKHKSIAADPALWRQRGISKSLQATVACSGNPPEQIYRALLLANAVNLLSFDINQQDKVKVPVSGNVGWLDFTHGLTFRQRGAAAMHALPATLAAGLIADGLLQRPQCRIYHGGNG